MQELQQQHSSVLASGGTAQVEAAQAADDACEAIRAKVTGKTGMPSPFSHISFSRNVHLGDV